MVFSGLESAGFDLLCFYTVVWRPDQIHFSIFTRLSLSARRAAAVPASDETSSRNWHHPVTPEEDETGDSLEQWLVLERQPQKD